MLLYLHDRLDSVEKELLANNYPLETDESEWDSNCKGQSQKPM